jgi:hypothetical protein
MYTASIKVDQSIAAMVFCTDGVSDNVTAEDMRQAFDKANNARELSTHILDRAISNARQAMNAYNSAKQALSTDSTKMPSNLKNPESRRALKMFKGADDMTIVVYVRDPTTGELSMSALGVSKEKAFNLVSTRPCANQAAGEDAYNVRGSIAGIVSDGVGGYWERDKQCGGAVAKYLVSSTLLATLSEHSQPNFLQSVQDHWNKRPTTLPAAGATWLAWKINDV